LRSITRLWQCALGLTVLLFASGADCSISIPAGGRMSLNGGAIDLGCTDLAVGGNLQLGSGAATAVRNLTISAGTPPEGTLDAGSGAIAFGGNWSNAGNFSAGSSHVQLVDACAASSTFTGTTTFYDLSLISNVGKVITVSPSITLFTLHALTILGTAANPIQITSGLPANVGYMNLAPGGTQNIAHVGVSDNWATGQHLAPLLTNEGGTGNSLGWFGTPLYALRPVPATHPWGLGLLALFIAGFGFWFRPDQMHPLARKSS
jgi:hypothetical protein